FAVRAKVRERRRRSVATAPAPVPAPAAPAMVPQRGHDEDDVPVREPVGAASGRGSGRPLPARPYQPARSERPPVVPAGTRRPPHTERSPRTAPARPLGG
ncbi:hypothetical protein AB0C89_16170, partial [Streptomyces sp. NPDC048491]